MNPHKIGLGTAAIGRPQYINIKEDSQQKDFSLDAFRQSGLKVLESAYDRGVRYFDTAPGYGMAQEMLTDWVSAKKDPSIEVATKWGYTYVADFDAHATVHEVKEHSLEKLNEQWSTSKRLLPFLKSYQIHSATLETGVLQNDRILNRLVELKSEHNLSIGLTTTGANQVQVLKSAMDTSVNGIEVFDLYQVTFNIFDQSLSTITDLFTDNKRLIIKEALANGRVFPNKNYPLYKNAYSVISQLADKYQVGIDAIALRFCIDSLPSYKVLSGASNQQHLLDNLKVLDFYLSKEEIAKLEKLAVDPEQYWNERKQLVWN